MTHRAILFIAAAFTWLTPAMAPVATAQDAAPSAERTPAPEVYSGPAVYRAEIVATYPHDTAAFTQGLVWHDGHLFESTGQEGQSEVRKVDLETGKVLTRSAIPADQFGEGLALSGREFISLTWRNGVIHRWNAKTLKPAGSKDGVPFEGWGLTTSDEGLIHSDGTATLRVLDPESFEVLRMIPVTMNGQPLPNLNELEMIDGLVYANVWQSPFIVAIDPADGVIKRLIDLRAIVDSIPMTDRDTVLNGIAWDPKKRRLFVTGKRWPSLFEINLVETEAQVR